MDNDKLRKIEIITPISNIQNRNTGDRGDCLYLPVISNRTILDSTNAKNEHSESSLNFEYRIDNSFRSNLASGEPEQNQMCFSTSSATFIVSSSSTPDITTQQNDDSIHNIIHSNTNMELLTPMKSCNNYQQQLWFKQHWILVTVIAGIIVIFIIIITTSIIH